MSKERTSIKKVHLILLLFAAVDIYLLCNLGQSPPGRPTLDAFFKQESLVEAPPLSGPQKEFIKQALELQPPDLSAANPGLLNNMPAANVLLSRWLESYFNVANDLAVHSTHPAHKQEILNVWGFLKPYGLIVSDKEPVWADLPMLSSEIVQDRLIEWSLPLLEEIWKQDANRDLIRATLTDLDEFLHTVDVEKEKAYMNNPGARSFVRVDANGNRRRHAKSEAFILRRISRGEISHERFIVLLDRLISIVKQWDQSLGTSVPEPATATAILTRS